MGASVGYAAACLLAQSGRVAAAGFLRPVLAPRRLAKSGTPDPPLGERHPRIQLPVRSSLHLVVDETGYATLDRETTSSSTLNYLSNTPLVQKQTRQSVKYEENDILVHHAKTTLHT